MQLKPTRISAAIGLLAASLLGGAAAEAQDRAAADAASTDAAQAINAYDQTASETGTLVADSAVLFYQEDGGRVRAIEAETGLTWNDTNGSIFSGKFTYDSLTGATPNGGIRSKYPQRFIPPRMSRAKGEDGEVDGGTGSSGTYIAPAGELPVDHGFKDHREALDLGATLPVAAGLKVSFGGAGSWETDYTSYSARLGLAKELNQKNTTLSLGLNYEHDRSHPFTGVPRGLGTMGDPIVGHTRVKRVYSLVAGVTQVLTPNWLVQANYAYGHSTGYQTDPYKVVALVDSASGDPFFAIYEKRPGRRDRHSVYLGTKLAIGSAVTDASARWYHDTWGVTSWTFAMSEHVPVGKTFYLEPEARWYHQTAAHFFRSFLYLDKNTPGYVSADSRLGRFAAWTVGLKGGAKVAPNIEVYGAAERYWQYGKHYDASLPGDLAQTDLFAGSKSFSLITGIRLTFR